MLLIKGLTFSKHVTALNEPIPELSIYLFLESDYYHMCFIENWTRLGIQDFRQHFSLGMSWSEAGCEGTDCLPGVVSQPAGSRASQSVVSCHPEPGFWRKLLGPFRLDLKHMDLCLKRHKIKKHNKWRPRVPFFYNCRLPYMISWLPYIAALALGLPPPHQH